MKQETKCNNCIFVGENKQIFKNDRKCQCSNPNGFPPDEYILRNEARKRG